MSIRPRKSALIAMTAIALGALSGAVSAAPAEAVVEQGGQGNTAQVEQFQVSGRAGVVQDGHHLHAHVLQVMSTGASALVMQSPLAHLDTAHILQSAVAPAAAIAQGVTGISAASSGAVGAVQALRSGQAVASSSDFSHAVLTQLGGPGLVAVIVQAGSGQHASIAQNGSHLEAAIVQSGAAHVASISQVGAGAPGSPYQALLTQAGNQPQGLAVHQLGGSSPRVIRVSQQ